MKRVKAGSSSNEQVVCQVKELVVGDTKRDKEVDDCTSLLDNHKLRFCKVRKNMERGKTSSRKERELK